MADWHDADNEDRHDWLDDREPEPVDFSEGDWGDEREDYRTAAVDYDPSMTDHELLFTLFGDFIPAPGFIPPYDMTDEDLPF